MTRSTLGEIRRAAAKRLTVALGADESPALDARLLVAAALKVPADRLSFDDDRPVDPADAMVVDHLLTRRIAGEPVARIIGEKEFWCLTLELVPATLVPRPDSETVVEAALGYVDRHGGRGRALRLVDIGTGSGAILLALLRELPNAVGLGIDLQHDAARAARNNAQKLGFGSRALFVRGNWSDCCGEADVVVSNPPYIASSIIETLPVAVRDHDPRVALDGGSDGLVAYRAIIADCRRSIALGGAAFLEIGFDQAASVSGLAAEAGFHTDLHRDLAGHDRVIALTRRT